MKKIAILIFLVLVMQAGTASAESLHVEKALENSSISVGDDARVLLKFINPFGQEVPIRVVDKNVFGNNGIDVQCLDYTLPADRGVAIAYEPVKPYSSGDYTLEPAEITYTNPQTGKEETVKSNSLKVTVKGTNAQQGQAQGITTIYRCDGVNMQSTSYSSSGSSINIQTGGSPSSQQSSSQDRVQNNQMNQNTAALKQQMKQDIQKQKDLEQDFQQELASNQEFQQMHNELLGSGYNITDGEFRPVTNDTGTFELSYEKGNGEEAVMKGELDNGTMKDIMTLTDEDKQRILDQLRENSDFQYYNRTLSDRGLNQTEPLFNQISQNYTEVSIAYENEEDANGITADYINGTVQNVSLKHKLENKDAFPWWILLFIPLMAAISWLAYKRYLINRNAHDMNPAAQKKPDMPIDYTKGAMDMLNEARKLFLSGMEKDAYEKASQAVRFYFSHALGIRREMMSSELVNALKKEKVKERREIHRCLNMCGMVEFAKYMPNKKDFNEIIDIAEGVILPITDGIQRSSR